MSEYKELMKAAYKAHQDFKKEWNDWRNGIIEPTEKKKLKKLNGREPQSITQARDRFLEADNRLFNAKLIPLEIAFLENPASVAAEVIEFLSVDIAAHRCGYAKEWFLTKLKSVELTADQKLNFQQTALTLCESSHFRREINYWSRLMIKLADEDFVRNLNALSISPNRFAQTKAKWLLNKILYHRKDLDINSLAA